MAKKTWAELSTTQKRTVVAAGAFETIMTLAVWRDLARRPASQVQGSKGKWALAALVQPVGPIAYFMRGRR